MTGSGMQQARDLRVEEAVEVVQNHEDGTGSRSGNLRDRSVRRRTREWTPGRVGRGARNRRISWEEVERSTRATGQSSEGEPRPEGPHGSGASRGVSGPGVKQSEDLEDPRGDAQGQGGSGEVQRPATNAARATR